jgi:hypothetical protein
MSLLPNPSPRELELAELVSETDEMVDMLTRTLVLYREELMRPFDELRRDMVDLGDHRVAAYLDELIKTARGAP